MLASGIASELHDRFHGKQRANFTRDLQHRVQMHRSATLHWPWAAYVVEQGCIRGGTGLAFMGEERMCVNAAQIRSSQYCALEWCRRESLKMTPLCGATSCITSDRWPDRPCTTLDEVAPIASKRAAPPRRSGEKNSKVSELCSGVTRYVLSRQAATQLLRPLSYRYCAYLMHSRSHRHHERQINCIILILKCINFVFCNTLPLSLLE